MSTCLYVFQTDVPNQFVSTIQSLVEEDNRFHSVITEEVYQRFSTIANDIVTPIICGLGLIANILSMGVLFRASRLEKLTIHVYLCCLTLLDSSFLFDTS